MALVIPEGFAEASVQLRNAGDPEPWYVTFGLRLLDYPDTPVEAADRAGGIFADTWLSQMNEATTLVGVNLKVGTPSGETISVFAPRGDTGVGSSAKLPQNCALLVRKQTSRGGRSGKGRMYIPNVLPESSVDNVGVIDPATVTAFQDVADSFRLQLAGELSDGTPLVLLHNIAVGVDPVPTPVDFLVVDSLIATQRRRLRR